jgi:hypothetical protein
MPLATLGRLGTVSNVRNRKEDVNVVSVVRYII